MKILFSPVGNTDPWRNDRDGAMLNILRHYKPEIVFLFFTKSIWEGNEKYQGHKEYNWENIIRKVSEGTKTIIEVDDIKEEHDFDSYKDLFHNYLANLERKYPKADFLLNVTSGTPQMETTLCLEYITYPDNKVCIQVATPLLTSNARAKYANPDEQEIDLEIVNSEEAEAESRCKEIAIISFREAMVRNQVMSLIDNFDYEAALQLVRAQKSFRNRKAICKELLEVTQDIKTHRVFSEIVKKYRNQELQKALLHFLILEMRKRRGDVAETLIRVKSIAEFIVEQYLNKNFPGLICYKDNKPFIDLSYASDFITTYKEYTSSGKYDFDERRILGFPAYRDFLILLEPKGDLLKQMNTVNNINNLRNKIAHNLDNLDLDKNSNESNIIKSVGAVKNMLKLVYPEIQEEHYDYFLNLNKRIKGML